MDFKVDSLRSSVGSNPDSQRLKFRASSGTNDREVRANLSDTSEDVDPEQAVKELSAENDTSQLTLSSNANRFISEATDALTQIAGLREQQLELAEEAKNGAIGSRLDSLNTQAQDIQTEINRIVSSANFNGQNPLDGATLTIKDDAAQIQDVVSIGNVRSVSSDLGINLSNPTSADSAYTAIRQNIVSSQSLLSGYDAAESDTESLLATPVAETPATTYEDGVKITTFEDAEKVAGAIVAKLAGSPFTAEELKSKLIATNNLDPDRVNSLLQDD